MSGFYKGGKDGKHYWLTPPELMARLQAALSNLISKGSVSTTPSWARRVVGKIEIAKAFPAAPNPSEEK